MKSTVVFRETLSKFTFVVVIMGLIFFIGYMTAKEIDFSFFGVDPHTAHLYMWIAFFVLVAIILFLSFKEVKILLSPQSNMLKISENKLYVGYNYLHWQVQSELHSSGSFYLTVETERVKFVEQKKNIAEYVGVLPIKSNRIDFHSWLVLHLKKEHAEAEHRSVICIKEQLLSSSEKKLLLGIRECT